jgi:hypothetical protein
MKTEKLPVFVFDGDDGFAGIAKNLRKFMDTNEIHCIRTRMLIPEIQHGDSLSIPDWVLLVEELMKNAEGKFEIEFRN